MSKILNNKVDVSVIMAAYNCEPYIRESIESILNQTFENFELIIVNDNSTDNTHEIIKSYNDSRIKILNNDNNYGAAYSRNVAIKHAQGKYLAIMDSDDVALQERLEKQVYFLENNIDIDIVGSFVFEIDKDGQKLSFVKTPINKNEVKSSILFRSPVIHSTTMIRHDFFISNDLFYNENYICAQDYEMFSRAIFLGNIYNIPQALVSYRWTDSNISTKKKDIQQQYSKEIISNLLSKFQIEPTKEDIEKHNIFINQEKFDKNKHTINEILDWCEFIYKKNIETNLFDRKTFSEELLLRLLRFSVVNSFKIFNILSYQIKMTCRFGKFYFPYFKIKRRRVIKYK